MKLVKVILYFVLQQMEVCLLFICLFCLLFLFFITKNQLFVYFFSGGQHTTTRVNINIIDVNDNYPRFEVQSYKRAIPEGKDTVVCLLFSDFCKQNSHVCLLFVCLWFLFPIFQTKVSWLFSHIFVNKSASCLFIFMWFLQTKVKCLFTFYSTVCLLFFQVPLPLNHHWLSKLQIWMDQPKAMDKYFIPSNQSILILPFLT